MPQDHVAGHVAQALLLSAGPWLLALGPPACLYAAWRWRRPLAWLPALLGYLLALGLPSRPAPVEGLRVVSANLNAFSEGPAGAEQVLADLAPDVLLVIERRAEQVPGLLRVADNYLVPMARISHGHAVHCRPGLVCQAAIAPEFGSDSTRMPAGLLRLSVPRVGGGSRPACVLSLHAPPPAPLDPTGLLPYTERVAGRIRQGRLVGQWGPCLEGDPVLAVGDFNTVPGSPAWSRWDATGLLRTERGAAPWHATWPAGGGWPDLPFFALDHALAGPELRVTGLDRVRVPGADHLALVLGLQAR